MSGGWDSTAVFGAGEHVLPAGNRARLQPVSISYPVGDPGREDEFIGQVADHWKARVHWIKSDDIPLLDGLPERAARADEPPAHLYELWNRELARATRAAGSRVALDGGGGDQLFQVSDVVIADRLRNGRFLEFARLARSRRSRGLRHLARAGMLPLVPEGLVKVAEHVTGRLLPHHYLERPLAEWIRPEFAARHLLRERDLVMLRRQGAKHLAHAESRMYLTLPVWSHGASFMHGSLLQEGVEVRSPLLDLKVVEFALSRPISERAGAGGTKTLLRQSMRGLLPPSILAPRRYRTGMTIGFSRRRMREGYPALISTLFAEPLRLADLGMVDPVKLRAAADRCCAGGGDEGLRVNLFHAMKVEFWLRGLDARAAVSSAGLEPTAAFASGPTA
jgi:asparagine synthase (glutamine-hydrolysing)